MIGYGHHNLEWFNSIEHLIIVLFNNQCQIKVCAIDAAALRPFKKQAHGHGREIEKSSLYFGCDFSG